MDNSNSNRCIFRQAWIGRCKNPIVEGDRCADHKDTTCCSCGKPATHDCNETGQFVCGSDLCDNCEHTIFADGTNGGIGFNAQDLPEGLKPHCKKTEQQFTPWYTRD